MILRTGIICVEYTIPDETIVFVHIRVCVCSQAPLFQVVSCPECAHVMSALVPTFTMLNLADLASSRPSFTWLHRFLPFILPRDAERFEVLGVQDRCKAMYFFEMSVLFETGQLNTYVYDSGGFYRRKDV